VSFTNIVLKLEQCQKTADLVLIAVDGNKTNEETYVRCFPEANIKPQIVIYATL
jgi:hypothetical protein